MEDKKGFGETLNAFFAGKGFYIVLLLCAGLIAVSIRLLTGGGAMQKTDGKEAKLIYGPEGAVPAMENTVPRSPAATMVPTPVPSPAAAATALPVMLTAPEESVMAESAATEAPEEELVYGLQGYYTWPVNGEVARGYAVETLSYDKTMADWRTHPGLDIAAAEGSAVVSVTDGTVQRVYADPRLGTTVEIDHGAGILSVYANLAPETAVKPGDAVKVGEQIGSVGRTASAESGEASHLHFAMTVDAKSADPTDYLPAR